MIKVILNRKNQLLYWSSKTNEKIGFGKTLIK